MELGLNLPRPDDSPPLPGADVRPSGPPPSTHAEISGEIAVGSFVLQVGEPGGAALREARRAERAHFRPRPSPILTRPRPIRGLVDRRTEAAAALSAIDAGLPVEVNGEPGVGKTALLRHLAHHPRAGAFVDGIVYLSARHRTSLDLQQRIFEAFYESDTICKPTAAEIRRALQDKHALILLDDVGLPQNELEDVLDIAPRLAFVVATRDRCLWGEVRSITLAGLAADDAAGLLERELERPLDVSEQPAAAALCAAIEGHPSRILQAAASIRRHGLSAGGWPKYTTPDGPVADLLASIDDKERRVLLALSALSPAGIEVRHVSALAEVPDVETAIASLAARALAVSDQSRYRLADGVRDRLRRTADLMPSVHRAITYFTAWAERQRRNRGTVLDASDALLRVQAHAADTRRWGETLALGRALEAALVVSARWGDWELALERCLAAAKATGNQSVEARVLHEIGTRAVCLGEEETARRFLTRAAAVRDALGEYAAAAVSRRNLGYLPAAVACDAREPETPTAEPPDLDSLPLRTDVEAAHHHREASGAGLLMLTVSTCAIVGGLTYLGVSGGLSWENWDRFRAAWSQPAVPQIQTADAASSPTLPREMTEVVPSSAPQPTIPVPEKASIRIFTARPGSIATSRPSNLCYAVSDAAQARIEPGVGEVDPAPTLTCRRVAPVRTTTYELSATGRDGVPVTERVVIIVR